MIKLIDILGEIKIVPATYFRPLRDSNSISGTSFHFHTVEATPNQLKKILGEPVYEENTGDSKVNFEWELETNNGDVFTVYDYKEYRPIGMDEKIKWHIGGHSSAITSKIEEILNRLLTN